MPPDAPQDTLSYTLHLPADAPDALAPEALATLITAHVHSLLPPQWIWHKDAWQLVVDPPGDVQDRRRRFGVVVERDVGKATSLSGTMRVGDAVDDEWLVVWLLREVSLKWPELVIS